MTGAHTNTLTHVTMGLGWDPAQPAGTVVPRGTDIDLNAAALSFAADRFVDAALHDQLISRDGAVRHLGDSVTGDGDGDNEVIVVDLTQLSPDISTVVFLVTCYTGQRFGEIDNGFCRIADNVTGIELAHIDLGAARDHTGFVLGKLHRPHGDWVFTLIGEPIQAQHAAEAVPQLGTYLA
ncbi:TerD family protein [Nocardia rhizosphaerihabitans]|uniref:TerD family protein n=1 Tax=Nocardia rhizosphaerihabitans TaxID=1691570 RepID=UPI003670792B